MAACVFLVTSAISRSAAACECASQHVNQGGALTAEGLARTERYGGLERVAAAEGLRRRAELGALGGLPGDDAGQATTRYDSAGRGAGHVQLTRLWSWAQCRALRDTATGSASQWTEDSVRDATFERDGQRGPRFGARQGLDECLRA
jgi:hypothetical protein